MANPEIKAECIRLRVEERLSLREIHKHTGAPKGTLSTWLRGYELTPDERAAKIAAAARYVAPKKERPPPRERSFRVDPAGFSREAKGQMAEAAVLYRMAAHGLHAFRPVVDGTKEDWVVRVPQTGALAALQVKWLKLAHHGGLPGIKLETQGRSGQRRRYDLHDFDFIVGYDYDSDTCYVFSQEETVGNKTLISVRADAAERWDKILDFIGRPLRAAA